MDVTGTKQIDTEAAGRNMKCLILLFIAIALITLDMSVNIGNFYPAYQIDYEHSGWEFQLYTLNQHYGAAKEEMYNPMTQENFVSGIHFTGVRIDVISDFIGYILAFIAMKKMAVERLVLVRKYPDKRRSPFISKLVKARPKMFSVGMMTAVIAFVLDAVKYVLPFLFNGIVLCYLVFVIGIAAFTARMLIGYCFIVGVCDTLRGIQFKQDRNAIYIGWFVSLVCSSCVALTTWVLLQRLTTTYNIIVLFATVFYLFRIFVLREYIVGYRPVSMEDLAAELRNEENQKEMLMEEYHYASKQTEDGAGAREQTAQKVIVEADQEDQKDERSI